VNNLAGLHHFSCNKLATNGLSVWLIGACAVEASRQ
jgi:hypothetical protein